jgi:hypothetical protein
MNKLNKKLNTLVLPKINKSESVSFNIIINNVQSKQTNKNPYIPIISLKSKQTNKIIKKNKFECVNAEEFVSQYQSIPDIYNFEETNKKIETIKKILLKQNIFFIKAPWNLVWDNYLYLNDYTYEYIYQRYNDLLYCKYDKIFADHSHANKKYSKKILCMLYVDKLVSFLSVSNYSFCMGKIYGQLRINCNFTDNNEKKIILDCFDDFFPNRFSYDSISNIILVYLNKK